MYQTGGIPAGHLQGVDKLFPQQYRHLSPAVGYLHSIVTTPRNLALANLSSAERRLFHSQADDLGPALQFMFVRLPSGRCTITHMPSNPAANLRPSTVAGILVMIERFRNAAQWPDADELAAQLHGLIERDAGYIDAVADARRARGQAERTLAAYLENEEARLVTQATQLKRLRTRELPAAKKLLEVAKADARLGFSDGVLAALEKAEHEEKIFLAEIVNARAGSARASLLERTLLPRVRAKIISLRNRLSAVVEETPAVIAARRSAAEVVNATQAAFDALSSKLELLAREGSTSTSEERRKARGSLERDVVKYTTETQAYTDGLDAFAKALSRAFITVEKNGQVHEKYAVTAALLSFMVMQMANKGHLKPYLQAMHAANFLLKDKSKEALKPGSAFFELLAKPDDYERLAGSFNNAFCQKKWTRDNCIEGALYVLDSERSTGATRGIAAFKHVDFSYASWMTYNRARFYADCTENGIGNVFNMLAFDPRTETYSADMLIYLKTNHYPCLSDRVVEFYRKFRTFAELNSPVARRAWLDTVTEHFNDPTYHCDHCASEAGVDDVHSPNQPCAVSDSASAVSNRSSRLHPAAAVPRSCDRVKYIRERLSCEVNSTYGNICRAINQLLGVRDASADHIGEAFAFASTVLDAATGETVHRRLSYSCDYRPGNLSSGAEARFTVGDATFQWRSWCRIHSVFKRIDETDDVAARDMAFHMRRKTLHDKPDAKARYYSLCWEAVNLAQPYRQRFSHIEPDASEFSPGNGGTELP